MIHGKKAVCFAMVKNEEDIIEVFVRHNLTYFDHIYITNNNSTDNTVLIVESLISEGLPITLWHDTTLAYEQSKITTEAYHKISTIMHFDLFFPLDADELLTLDSNFALNDLGDDICFVTSYANYVTLQSNERAINMTSRFKPVWEGKIFINQNNVKFKHVIIEQGNHSIRYGGVKIKPLYIPAFRINHFANRGINHYLNKYIIGSQAMMVLHKTYSTGKSPLAIHWYKEYEFIKRQKGKVTFDKYIQQVYSANSIDELKDLTIEDPIFVNLILKYSDIETNLVHNLILNYENLEKGYWKIKNKLYFQRFIAYAARRLRTIRASINKKISKLKR